MKARSMQNSSISLKQEFLKKWIKGVKICNTFKSDMSILDRKRNIKMSADVAIASTTTAKRTQWSRALISDIVSTNETSRNLVEQISDGEVRKRATTGLAACSKKILRKSHIARRKPRRVVPTAASSIARKLVKNRTRMLKALVPGGKEMDEVSLIRETLDYIMSLRVQVEVMRHLTSAAEKLDASKCHCN